MRLTLVRHPKPRLAEGLCYGRLDLECEPEALHSAVQGLREAAGGHVIMTSPARRARDLATRLGSEVIVEPRLQELHFGEWEGKRWHDIGRAPIEAWRSGLPSSSPPGGETLNEMAKRCADWLNALDPHCPPVLAITHAGPIRVIRALLRHEPLLTYFSTDISFAEPIELEVGPGSRRY